MKDYVFDLATAADDASIRRLLRENPVPARITVSYEREPDYFIGCGTMGPFCQVIVARHLPTGRIVGLACRASRPMYVNGELTEVGYLGQLRVDERFKGRWLVSYGMRYVWELHQDGRVPGYITTIIEDNAVARGVLVERARPHHPIYRKIGRLLTLVLVLRRPYRNVPSPYTIIQGSEARLVDVVEFLNQHGLKKNFFPAYSMDDFRSESVTPHLDSNDLFIALLDGEMVGVMGIWNQSAFKQTVVRGYPWFLNAVRPAYNLVSRFRGGQPLPASGQALKYAYASFVCIKQNEPEIFKVLLRQVCNETSRRGFSHLSLGLEERDPLVAVATNFPHILYPSHVFTVSWAEESQFHEQLDDRILHLELATL